LNLLLKAHNRGRDVVGGEIRQASQQAIACRLFPPLQDGQVIGVQQDGHVRSTFQFSRSDQATQTNNLAMVLVALKIAEDLAIPRRCLAFGKRSLHSRQFMFKTGQSCFEFLR